MSGFKVGDKVRVVKSDYADPTLGVGKEGIVEEPIVEEPIFGREDLFRVKVEGLTRCYPFYESELELLPPKKILPSDKISVEMTYADLMACICAVGDINGVSFREEGSMLYDSILKSDHGLRFSAPIDEGINDFKSYLDIVNSDKDKTLRIFDKVFNSGFLEEESKKESTLKEIEELQSKIDSLLKSL